MYKGKTDEQLATIAQRIRDISFQNHRIKPDIRTIVSHFLNSKDPKTKIILEPIPAYRSTKVRAEADPSTRTIYADKETNTAFWEGQPWALAVFLEEIAHVILQHSGTRSNAKGVDQRAINIQQVRCEEDEATRLICYIWVPVDDAYCLADKSGLVKIFGMPSELADQYWDHIRDLQTHFGVKRIRQLPDNVVELSEHRYKTTPTVQVRLSYPKTSEAIKSVPVQEHGNQVEMADLKIWQAKIAGYLSVKCKGCGKFKMRTTGNCMTCDDCNFEDGCD